MTYASVWKRIAATLIDFLIVAAVTAGGFAVVSLLGGLVGSGLSALTGIDGIKTFAVQRAPSWALWLLPVIGIVLVTRRERSDKQATLGKAVLGIKVTDMHGNKPNEQQYGRRWLLKLILAGLVGLYLSVIPLETSSPYFNDIFHLVISAYIFLVAAFGLITALFIALKPTRQGPHDLWAKTLVINDTTKQVQNERSASPED